MVDIDVYSNGELANKASEISRDEVRKTRN